MAGRPDGERRPKAPSGAQTVERAIAVLRCFGEAPTTASVSEVARRLDLNVSAVYRIVRAMESAGFLEQDATSRRYRLGTAVAGLNRVLFHQRRFHLAQPELRRLSAATSAHAILAVRDGDEALVVGDMPASGSTEDWETEVANVVPLHASALGKVLLAWSDEPGADLARLAPFESFTERTITDRKALAAELHAIRARGHAVSDREMFSSQLTVAVPILDASGRAYLALGVGLTWSKARAAKVERVAELARECARRLRPILVETTTW